MTLDRIDIASAVRGADDSWTPGFVDNPPQLLNKLITLGDRRLVTRSHQGAGARSDNTRSVSKAACSMSQS